MLRPLCLVLVLAIVSILADPTATILRSKYENDGNGNYEFWTEQSDGVYRWETGELRHTKDGRPFIFTTGGYAYYDYAKGRLRVTEFEADENGYRPTSYEEDLPPGAPPRFMMGSAGG